MEDAATAEIARSQVWQWLHNDVATGQRRDGHPGAGRAGHRRGAGQGRGPPTAAGTTRGRCSARWRCPTSSPSSSPCPRTNGCPRSQAMAGLDGLAARLRAELGPRKVIDDRQELRTYECDGLAHYKVDAGAGGAAGDHRRGRRRRCGPAPTAGVPFVARGSGTGLSGGALPHADGVLVVTSRMRRILEVDRDGAARRGRAGRDQPAGHQGRRPARLLLRAGPVQPAGLLDRRQRRGELRRRALPEVRLHHQPRARRRAGRPRTATWSSSAGRRRTRPATTCSARSSARRARWASPPRSPCG